MKTNNITIVASLFIISIHILNTNGQIKINDFWNQFRNEILATSERLDGKEAVGKILDQGAEMIRNNKDHAFACQAACKLATKYYKYQKYTNSIKTAQLALKLPETDDGHNYIIAWNIIAESYKMLNMYQEAINASDKVLQNKTKEDVLTYNISQMALTRKADIILLKTNSTRSERVAAESILKSLTEISNTGPLSEYAGQMTRARISNLNKIGNKELAYEVGEEFIENNPTNYWSPCIAEDLCRLTNNIIAHEDFEIWLKYFKDRNTPDNAAIANLKLELMAAYAREGMNDKAQKIGKYLLKYKKHTDDPVPWRKPHTDSVKTMMTVTKGEILRDEAESHAKKVADEKQAVVIKWWLLFQIIIFATLFVICIKYAIKCKKKKA